VELWATRQRRPSAAANPQGSPRPPRSPPASCNPRPGAVDARYRSGPTGRYRYAPRDRWHRPSSGPLRTSSCATAARRRRCPTSARGRLLIRTPAVSSLSVNAVLVNCAPWSVLKISGCPFLRASSSASRQNEVSIVFDRRQARTYRLYQSITATR